MRTLSIISIILALISCGNKDNKTAAPGKVAAIDSVAIMKEAILKDSLNPALWQKLYELQIAKGDTAGGLRSLKLYTYLVPEDGNAWLELAWLLADQKDPQILVVADSLQKVDDVGIRSKAKFLTGVYYSNLGQDEKAIAIFDSVIISNYSFVDAYMEKGIILYDQKKFDQALKTFQQAFLLRKNDPEIYLWIGKSYAGLGNKVEAEDWMKKYQALNSH